MYKQPKKLKVVLKKVNEQPEIIEIENTLEAKQKLVGGLIELVSLTEDILLICNEEGKLENLLPNLTFDYDYIAGNCFFVGDDYEHGDFKSLTDEQIKQVEKICNERSFVNYLDLDNSNGKELE